VGPRKAVELVLNGEPVGGHAAVELGLVDAFCPAATALREGFRVARELASGARPFRRRDWDAAAAAQRAELDEVLASREAAAILAASPPGGAEAGDLAAARRYAGRVALEALRAGYEREFEAGLANDARLFGSVTSSPSGQHWIGRFLQKDARQGAMLTLWKPA